jgi:hypothetical protein
VGPGPVWTGEGNLTPTGIRSPDRPARSQSLYRLSHCGPHQDRGEGTVFSVLSVTVSVDPPVSPAVCMQCLTAGSAAACLTDGDALALWRGCSVELFGILMERGNRLEWTEQAEVTVH